ncbi:MAG: lipid-A-disaccharide synthase [Thermodesulfovibrio sp.]|jgi:lipid-A-disaccharide synthase|uniref:Lipid-A-disaccharide synthase n=2 Tax=Thermodesulfovibrio TaxID=28261 RepID=A0A2J6WI46_9BACT|nr:MAG: lipid-A-disaccharide synthase [Thermodesulfovibrio aggregans]
MSAKLLIVAGESSGELYGSLLASYLKEKFELIGIGGKYMAQSGVKLIGEITHSFGGFEVLGHIKKIRKNMEAATKALKEVQGVILIDFPDFNLTLAKKAKEMGKKVLYYVSPQIWAWRHGRINIIRKVVDFMAVVLPFEETIYKKAGVPVKFVGHPMFEAMIEELPDEEHTQYRKFLREKYGISQDTVVTLMPGSRPSEIKRKMPLMLELIKIFPSYHFIIPKAPNIEFSESTLKKITSSGNVTILKEKSFTALAMSDVAVITSGTSTLQATLLKIPMVVIYRLNPLSYVIGKAIIKGVKHITLPNVIADFMNLGDVRVPEFIQKFDTKIIAEQVNLLLYDNAYREKIINFLDSIRKYFVGKKASLEVSEICKQLF